LATRDEKNEKKKKIGGGIYAPLYFLKKKQKKIKMPIHIIFLKTGGTPPLLHL
jgi:hypothetical protein